MEFSNSIISIKYLRFNFIIQRSKGVVLTMKEYCFPKSERLKSKKIIDDIFLQGQSFFSYPIKVVFLLKLSTPEDATTQALFVVPKKRFKRAVDRNKLKRRLREAFRLNKTNLLNQAKENHLQLFIAFIFAASEKESYSVVNKSMEKTIHHLEFAIVENRNKSRS